MKKKQNKRKSILTKQYLRDYSATFVFIALLCLFYFIVNKKSLVYYDNNGGGDGLVIHYNSFVYYGRYVRSIIRGFLKTGTLVIPMWDLSIGFGQDIVQTLWFYAIGDPFYFLSTLIPTKYSEFGYCAITIIELYCAGLSFSYYSLVKDNPKWSTLIGAMIYVWSSYPLILVTMHPYFSLPMVTLPLLLLAIDDAKGKRWSPRFIIIVAITAISDFYFFYMQCIFAVLYALVLFFTNTTNKSIKSFFSFCFKYIINGIIGVGISAVLLLPIIYSLTTSNRVAADNYLPLLYPADYYQHFLISIMGGGSSYNTHMGYTPLFLLAVLVLLIKKKDRAEYKVYRIILAMLVLFACIPFVAHIFNGFAYVTNRWIWGFGFFAALLIAELLPVIRQFNKKDYLKALIIVIGYALLVSLFSVNRNLLGVSMIAILFISLALAYCFREKKENLFKGSIIGLTALSLAINAFFIFSPHTADRVSLFGEAGNAYKDLTQTAPGKALDGLYDKSFYRFDTAGISQGEVKRNSNMLLKKYGTSHYYSTNGGNYYPIIRDFAINNDMEQTYTNLGRRVYLDSIAGVKYMVIAKGQERRLPFGFEKKEAENSLYSVYSTNLSLPMAFTTDKIIKNEKYLEATPVQKQQAIVQGIALDNDVLKNAHYIKPKYSDKEISYRISGSKNATMCNGLIKVTEENAYIDFEIEDLPNSELYCCLEGFDYDDPKGDKTTAMKTSTIIELVVDEEIKGVVHYLNSKNAYYCGLDTFLVNIGYDKNSRNNVRIIFRNAGEYTFKKFAFISQPMDLFEKQVKALPSPNEDVEIELSPNKVTCTVEPKREEFLFLSLLYSDGWRAFVDGRETKIFKADNVFMAIHLDEDAHIVELRYRTPLLKEGLIISAASILILIAIIIITNNKERREIL